MIINNNIQNNLNSVILNNNKYVLWFHANDNEKWDISSYIKILECFDLNDICIILKLFNNINYGMFFYMKNDCIPIWEDKSYNNLSFWTFKVSKNESKLLWDELIYYISFNSIFKDKELNKYLIGLSVSPKINNSIFKIWINNSELNSVTIFREDLINIDLNQGLFRNI